MTSRLDLLPGCAYWSLPHLTQLLPCPSNIENMNHETKICRLCICKTVLAPLTFVRIRSSSINRLRADPERDTRKLGRYFPIRG